MWVYDLIVSNINLLPVKSRSVASSTKYCSCGIKPLLMENSSIWNTKLFINLKLSFWSWRFVHWPFIRALPASLITTKIVCFTAFFLHNCSQFFGGIFVKTQTIVISKPAFFLSVSFIHIFQFFTFSIYLSWILFGKNNLCIFCIALERR
jgi:hypothetical protein